MTIRYGETAGNLLAVENVPRNRTGPLRHPRNRRRRKYPRRTGGSPGTGRKTVADRCPVDPGSHRPLHLAAGDICRPGRGRERGGRRNPADRRHCSPARPAAGARFPVRGRALRLRRPAWLVGGECRVRAGPAGHRRNWRATASLAGPVPAATDKPEAPNENRHDRSRLCRPRVRRGFSEFGTDVRLRRQGCLQNRNAAQRRVADIRTRPRRPDRPQWSRRAACVSRPAWKRQWPVRKRCLSPSARRRAAATATPI